MRPPSILPLPSDATVVEEKIVNLAYAHLYRTLENPMDKFIVAFMFDMGNGVETTAIASGLSRKTVWAYHQRIKQMLADFKVNTLYFSDDE